MVDEKVIEIADRAGGVMSIAVRMPMLLAATALSALMTALGSAQTTGARPVAPVTPHVAHHAATVLSGRQAVSSQQLVEPVASTTDDTDLAAPFTVFVTRNTNAAGRGLPRAGRLVAVTSGPHRGTVRVGNWAYGMSGFSIPGRILTVRDPYHSRRVDWWQPGSSRHGSWKLPAGYSYATGAPDGWLEVDSTGTLVDQPANGDPARTLAQPLPGDGLTSYTAGPTGVVVAGEDSLAFVRYDTGAVTQLDASDEATTTAPQRHLSCPSVSTPVAACETVAGYRFDELNVFIDPLNGGAALANSTDRPHTPVALGRSAAWPAHRHLTILSASRTRKSKAKIVTGRDSAVVAGENQFVTKSPSETDAIGIRRNGSTAGHVFATHSVTQAYGFTLTRHHVLWKEDDRASGATRNALMQRRIATSATDNRINAGPPQRRDWSNSTATPILKAGSTLVFVRRLTPRSGNTPLRTLRIETPAGNHTITGVAENGVGVGDHRLLYFTATSTSTSTAPIGRLYNLKSHHTRSLDAITGALSGHLLAYLTPAGRLLVRDLKGGGITEITSGLDATISADTPKTQIFRAGRYVGWNTHSPQRSGYRIADASSPAVALPADEKIRTMSATAIVTIKRIATGSFPGGWDLAYTAGEKFYLHTFGADQDSKLLVGNYIVAAPVVLAHMMAWIDPYGQLKARVLNEGSPGIGWSSS